MFPNLVELIEAEGRKVKDIAFAIHNHPDPSRFSPADIRIYNKLKNNGFTGKFGIYYPFSGTIIYYEDK